MLHIFCFVEQSFMAFQSRISKSIFLNFSHPSTLFVFIASVQQTTSHKNLVLRKCLFDLALYYFSSKKDKIKFRIK